MSALSARPAPRTRGRGGGAGAGPGGTVVLVTGTRRRGRHGAGGGSVPGGSHAWQVWKGTTGDTGGPGRGIGAAGIREGARGSTGRWRAQRGSQGTRGSWGPTGRAGASRASHMGHGDKRGSQGAAGTRARGIATVHPRHLFQDGRIRLLHAADGHRVPGLAVGRDVPRAGRAAAPHRRRVPGALGPRAAHAGTAGGCTPRGLRWHRPGVKHADFRAKAVFHPSGGWGEAAGTAGGVPDRRRAEPRWPCCGSAGATWP